MNTHTHKHKHQKLEKYCEYSRDLILELKTQQEIIVPPYNSLLIEKIKKEQKRLSEKIEHYDKKFDEMSDNDNDDDENENDNDNDERKEKKESLYPYFKILISCYERNKRSLIAYSYERTERIKEIYWGNMEIPEELKKRMSEDEKEYMKEYIKVIDEIEEIIGMEFLENKDPLIFDCYVNVVVLKDAGEVKTYDGNYIFKKDVVLRMWRSEASKFESNGIVKVLHS